MSKIIKYNNLTFDQENKINIDLPVFTEIKYADNEYNEELESDEQKNDEDVEDEITAEDILEVAKMQAENVVAEARREAEAIVFDAEEKAIKSAAEIKEKAQQEGYDLGYKQAVEESYAMKSEAEQILISAKEEKEQMLSDAEPDIIKLTIGIIDKVLNDTKIVNHDAIKCIIKKGLSQTKVIGDIFIHVSANDFEAALNNKDEILTGSDGSANIEIIKDLSMNVGDCLIETPFGNIDCGIDQQFNEIKNNLYYILENR